MSSHQTYRILFPENYLTPENLTWVTSFGSTSLPIYNKRQPNDLVCSFGGVSDESINPFFYFIRFSQIPAGSGITSVSCLDLGVHIRRFDDLGYCAYYQHDENGSPSFMTDGANLLSHLPEQPSNLSMNDIGSILKTDVILSPILPERDHSEWDIMNQIGGDPTWVQGEDTPWCPLTKSPMRFIMSLSCLSLPATDGQYGFYSEGVFYVFWSDHARISAIIYQQT